MQSGISSLPRKKKPMGQKLSTSNSYKRLSQQPEEISLDTTPVGTRVDAQGQCGVWYPAKIFISSECTDKTHIHARIESKTGVLCITSSDQLAPYGSRYKPPLQSILRKWRKKIEAGTFCDAMDHTGKWFPATIQKVVYNQGKLFSVHFSGWSSYHDEWIQDKTRLAPKYSYTDPHETAEFLQRQEDCKRKQEESKRKREEESQRETMEVQELDEIFDLIENPMVPSSSEMVLYLQRLPSNLVGKYTISQTHHTLLHVAVIRNRANVCSYIVQFAPHILRRSDKEGNLPIHLAAKYADISIVRLLASNWPYSVRMRNNFNRKPIQVALERDVPDQIVKYLMSVETDNMQTLQSLKDGDEYERCVDGVWKVQVYKGEKLDDLQRAARKHFYTQGPFLPLRESNTDVASIL